MAMVSLVQSQSKLLLLRNAVSDLKNYTHCAKSFKSDMV